jgi:pyruvate decarboxylase
VGELSAINGIAGAFSEHVPVVHIVGCPSTISQRNGMLLHHTLGNGNFNVFADMSTHISCAVAKLQDPLEIASQIDYVLRECWIRSRPVYILLPTDIVQRQVEGVRLATPIDLKEPDNDQEREDFVVDMILTHIKRSVKPVILVDACAIRHKVLTEVRHLIDQSGLPVYVTPMGKGAIDETHPNFRGTYAGIASSPAEARDQVENSDLVLAIGALKSDFNTAGFSYRTSQLRTIDFHSDRCVVGFSEFPGVSMRGVLTKVAALLVNSLSVGQGPDSQIQKISPQNVLGPQAIEQAWFWPRIEKYLEENDVIVTETGTSNFGIWDINFPAGCMSLNQTLWGSIGWSVGACQGAALAIKDMSSRRRTILFVGDGSFQLTAQEVSTMLRHDLCPTIFILCNDGYTIERLIHGMDAEYNDIANWRYKDIVDVFRGNKEARTFQTRTTEELDSLLRDETFVRAEHLQVVEVYMDKRDAPRALVKIAEQTAKLNAATD